MIDVLFVLMPESLVLDWAGPAEAFRLANQSLVRLREPPAFRLRFIGPDEEAMSSVGARIMAIEPLPELLKAPSWVVLIGQPDEAKASHAKSRSQTRVLTHWLRSISSQLQSQDNKLVTICAGALYAAQAGLLAGARATTHHLEIEALRKLEPRCEVQANRVFVIDDEHHVYSSAGITTGIDLAVHLIAQQCGEAIAARVAQVMVMPLRRSENDPEHSPFLLGRHHLHAAIHRVQDAITQSPQDEWSVPRMAEIACTSPRHLARLFAAHVGLTPLAYLRHIRLQIAERARDAGQSVTQSAMSAGFSSDTQLRRARHAARVLS
jgi:transcriptional regulator GlxA family with amidase domain